MRDLQTGRSAVGALNYSYVPENTHTMQEQFSNRAFQTCTLLLLSLLLIIMYCLLYIY